MTDTPPPTLKRVAAYELAKPPDPVGYIAMYRETPDEDPAHDHWDCTSVQPTEAETIQQLKDLGLNIDHVRIFRIGPEEEDKVREAEQDELKAWRKLDYQADVLECVKMASVGEGSVSWALARAVEERMKETDALRSARQAVKEEV
jgi:hypothetical protein